MEILLARLISIIFHPLLMPTIAVGLLFGLGTHLSFAIRGEAQLLIILIVFVNTAIAPLLVILLLKKTGCISNLFLNDRSDRIYPAIFTFLLYLFTWFLFKQANLPELLVFFVAGSIFLTIAALFVTLYWKISIHMMSIGGFTGFLICVSFALQQQIGAIIILSILISGLLGTARIRLNAHTPSQVYAGYITGLGIMLAMYWLYF